MPKLTISYDQPTDNDLDVYYRFYEDGKLVVDNIAVTKFTYIAKEFGEHSYTMTGYDPSENVEGEHSAPITKVFTKPLPPTSITISWEK